MATISSTESFILKELKFSTLANTRTELIDDVFETFMGETYEDIIILLNGDEDDNDGSGANLAGFGFSLDANDNATGGTVELLEGVGVGGEPAFVIQGLNISLVAIDNTIDIPGFADDLAIWTTQFSGKDTMILSDFKDNMRGFDGNDTMKGRAGADKLYGDAGKDSIWGGNGKDLIEGGSGNDVLRGGKGHDIVKGGKGADKIYGDSGTDQLIGGKGADTFVFVAGNDTNTVTDFGLGADKLKLNDSLWDGVSLTNTQIVNQFAVLDAGTITFDFDDGDILILDGYSDLAGLDALLV